MLCVSRAKSSQQEKFHQELGAHYKYMHKWRLIMGQFFKQILKKRKYRSLMLIYLLSLIYCINIFCVQT